MVIFWPRVKAFVFAGCMLAAIATRAPAQQQTSAPTVADCPQCAEWNQPHKPFKVFGNSYYVGTAGLSAILITGPQGHVLVDGGLAKSAPLIAANIRTLGFRVEDVRLIVNSHAHFDHAGGIAELQRASGARVVASAPSARTMSHGEAQPDDPQYGIGLHYPPLRRIDTIRDGDTVRVGTTRVTAHFTGGHTPGGTTWSWRSCEGSRCADIVYADSFSPVSADNFRFTENQSYPRALDDFAHSFAVLESLPCDLLLTPHPSQSNLWERVAKRDAGDAAALLAPGQCASYAATGRRLLADRVVRERGAR